MTVKEIQQYVVDWMNSNGTYEQLAEKIELTHDGEKWRRKAKSRKGEFEFSMPTEEEFVKYWEFYEYDPVIAKDAYWRYRNNGWRDKYNKPVKNWKSKCNN